MDDAEAEVDIPERRDAFSDALSEFMPSPRLAANSLSPRMLVKAHHKKGLQEYSRVEFVLVDLHTIVPFPIEVFILLVC